MTELSKTYISYVREAGNEEDFLKKILQNPPEVVDTKEAPVSNFNARKTLEVYRNYIKKTRPVFQNAVKQGAQFEAELTALGNDIRFTIEGSRHLAAIKEHKMKIKNSTDARVRHTASLIQNSPFKTRSRQNFEIAERGQGNLDRTQLYNDRRVSLKKAQMQN